jgi:hypothetical protein
MSPLASRQKRQCCIQSPSTKRTRKAIGEAIKEEALKELLKIKALGQGRLPYGAMDRIVKKYHDKGYPEVTRDNLNYRLKKVDKEQQKKEAAQHILQLGAERTRLIGVEIPAAEASLVETSDLSGSSKSGGHPKGSTKAAANQQTLVIQIATADCVQNYLERKAAYGKK